MFSFAFGDISGAAGCWNEKMVPGTESKTPNKDLILIF